MKINSTLLFSSLFLTAIFYSCGDCSKKIDCPAYKDDVLNTWFPYTDNQQLIFKSNLNEQDTITLKNTFTTEVHQEAGSIERAVVCSAEKLFQSTQKDSVSMPRFSLILHTSDQGRDAIFYLRRSNINLYNFNDAGLPQVSINSKYAASQTMQNSTLVNRSFPVLIKASADTLQGKINGIYIVYFTKGEGVVGYSEYPSLKTWVKQ